jgi:hypothetical protein
VRASFNELYFNSYSILTHLEENLLQKSPQTAKEGAQNRSILLPGTVKQDVGCTKRSRVEWNEAGHKLAQSAKITDHLAVWCFNSLVCVEQTIIRDYSTISE